MRSALLHCVLIAESLTAAAFAATSDPVFDIGPTKEPSTQALVGTAITYQGKLDKNGVPVNGACNMIFKLFDASTGGTQIGTTIVPPNPIVPTNGFFTTSLDFGAGVFNGQARWLEIAVQGPADPGFTTLTPRQSITPAPYAVYALGGPVNGSQWTNDANGIEYLGDVGIGTASRSDLKLHINADASLHHCLYLTSNQTEFASLVIQNSAPNGWGIIDDTSGRHSFFGKVAVGVLNGEGKLTSYSSTGGMPAVFGKHTSDWVGVWGESQSSSGTVGKSNTWSGVYGESNTNAGVWGRSNNGGYGVYGEAQVAGGIGGYFRNNAGGEALHVDGKAAVKTLQILGGADLAERFVAGEEAEPGTVMAIDPKAPGHMRIADEPYCRRVAGVVSGAGSLPAGVTLGMQGQDEAGSVPIALTGRVWVKCDAISAPIQPGDLLTTSKIRGHAMAATDASRSAGAILGKAMTSLEAGTGMVLVLVSLQ
jgi:hypothetical protein